VATPCSSARAHPVPGWSFSFLGFPIRARASSTCYYDVQGWAFPSLHVLLARVIMIYTLLARVPSVARVATPCSSARAHPVPGWSFSFLGFPILARASSTCYYDVQGWAFPSLHVLLARVIMTCKDGLSHPCTCF
jgi:hypothetical protein